MLSPADGYRALRGAGARVATARDLLWVRGADTVAFLQGQLSADVAGLVEGASTRSFLLEPQGKVSAWLRVSRRGDAVALDVEPGRGAPALARLERFKLRTDADIELIEAVPTTSVRGVGVGEWSGSVEHLGAPAGWPGLDGYDLLGAFEGPAGELPAASLDALEAVRIECGVPANGTDLTDATIPAEAGPWVIDASVSFTKGCYTGQELVARIDSRGGQVPRPLRGLVVETETPPPVGSPIVLDRTEVGTITSSAWSPGLGAAVALAPVARSVSPGRRVEVVVGAVSTPAELRTVPFTP